MRVSRGSASTSGSARPANGAKVVAVVLTHDRPAMLARCLSALASQVRPPDRVIVVDNASRVSICPAVDDVLPGARVITLPVNIGPAAGFAVGIEAALAEHATHVWLMDDDGQPAEPTCLARLLTTAAVAGSALTCPLVRDVADPARLAFPIRQNGWTRFTVAGLRPRPLIEGFAHLFNGALITAAAFARIGLPKRTLVIRGDEVEFLLRAKRAGLRVVTDTQTGFLHPSSGAEIHPILGGAFYAVVPCSPFKRHYQFRNRGWVFARYGKWGWLAADHVRYACYYLGTARDPSGYGRWLLATWSGVAGRLDAVPGTGVAELPHLSEPASAL